MQQTHSFKHPKKLRELFGSNSQVWGSQQQLHIALPTFYENRNVRHQQQILARTFLAKERCVSGKLWLNPISSHRPQPVPAASQLFVANVLKHHLTCGCTDGPLANPVAQACHCIVHAHAYANPVPDINQFQPWLRSDLSWTKAQQLQ